MIKLALISDTHEHNLAKWNIPEVDILIHAGDFTARGSLESVRKVARQLSRVPARYRILVPGNHDRLLFSNPKLSTSILSECGVILLVDETIEILGLRIHGTPWIEADPTHELRMAEHICYCNVDCRDKYALIPDGVDILISHVPPSAMLDFAFWYGKHIGSSQLASQVIQRIRPRLHVFGHVHEGRGYVVTGPTTFVNAAMCDHGNRPCHSPYIVTWDGNKFTVEED